MLGAAGGEIHRAYPLRCRGAALSLWSTVIRLAAIDRPLVRLPAAPVPLAAAGEHRHGSGVRIATQPVQAAQALRKGTHTACLGDQEFGVDVSATCSRLEWRPR